MSIHRSSLYFILCLKPSLLAVPVITQSDLGKENNGIANAQTIIRQHLDPTLTGTLQHRFTNHHNNILSEIKWSVFRRDFSPGFEDILEEGVHNGWYDVKDVLDKCVDIGLPIIVKLIHCYSFVFRWIGIPWLQAEIDEWVRYKNRNSPRANKNKILPHGIPSLIRAKPQRYNALDFKVNVTLIFLCSSIIQCDSRFQLHQRSLTRSKLSLLLVITQFLNSSQSPSTSVLVSFILNSVNQPSLPVHYGMSTDNSGNVSMSESWVMISRLYLGCILKAPGDLKMMARQWRFCQI